MLTTLSLAYYFFDMKNRTTLKINGTDAQGFLQGQLSNDIDKIKQGEWQLNAYCQHQGKIIALFWVTKDGADFYLNFPSCLKEKVLQRLNMFVLMADVDISKAKLGDKACVLLTHKRDFQQEYAEVYLQTSEKFLPQDLNLDIDEVGVNFSKGCYPGQEVVARLHYLGKPKRRMRLFKCKKRVEVGDELVVSVSKSMKASGQVVRCVKSADKSLCLATIEVAHENAKITLKDVNGVQLTRVRNA